MNLSIRFPSVPAINIAAIHRLSFFLVNNQINNHIPTQLIKRIKRNGTGNDRDIPVFKTGTIRDE